MFLAKNGSSFTNLEYGLMAEYLGKSKIASEVCVPCVRVAFSEAWPALD